ncbi:hypothetical protein EDC01DRAFT_56340 [Geopyxis carbonaria]|nr:hypothetical protein EDC01DRAFT_56340 [Geopyxis carbonaria]
MAPVVIANLVNDLVVLCPNSNLGCTSCVGCSERILRRDVHEECMHQEIVCTHCSATLRKLDLENHELRCPHLTAECNHCAIEFPRSDILEHESACEEAIIACSSSSVGCPWSGRRKESSDHAASCAFTYLHPLLQDHADRITALEFENKALRTKVEASFSSRSNIQRAESNSGSSLDDQTLQIITEQEHIRSDMERMFASMAEMDIKQNMLTMHMSESMRTKEEVAMIGAAVNNIRTTLHGLQMLTLRRQNIDQRSTGNGSPGPTTGVKRSTAVEGTGSIHPIRRLNASSSGDRVKL